jgi:hypothetical protein
MDKPELMHNEYAPVECLGLDCPICKAWTEEKVEPITEAKVPEGMPSILFEGEDTDEWTNTSYTGSWPACDVGGEG